MGSSESALVALSEAHPLPSALALTRRYRRLGCPVALPCRVALADVVYLPRITASRVDDCLGKSDRVLGGSRVISAQSSVIGWVDSTVAQVG